VAERKRFYRKTRINFREKRSMQRIVFWRFPFIRKHPGILCTGTFFVELSVSFTVVFHLGIFEQGIDIYMKDDPAGHVSNIHKIFRF